MEAIVDEKQFDGIQQLGFTSESIIEDLSAFEEQLRASNYFDPFHSYEETVQEMQQFQNDHPDIAKMQSLGKSWEDRDIWALKISDNVAVEEANEAEALFMANIHAREMITPEIIMFFMHWLIDNYNTDPRATYLVNNRQLWLIPTTNPDGRVYVFTGNYSGGSWQSGPIAWRKNKRDNNGNNQFDSYYDGVDLNRNFGYMWGLDSGSGSYPSDETYRGPESFSEPESQAIKNFVQSHRFVISLSYHSYGRWWIFPWGYTNFNPDTPDHAQFIALADSCIAYNGYTSANGDDFDYLVSGDTDDWLYGDQTTKNKIFAFTPEVGSSSQGAFWPDTSLIPQLIEENMGPNIFLAYAAGEEPII
ncbi:MAG TPA: M14 family metallopeptidase, partial [bacterium]